MRLTQALSRQHELDADAMAARDRRGHVDGERPRHDHAAGLVYETYLNSEVGVVVGAGFRPPLAEGFSRFLQAVGVVTALDEAVRGSAPAEPPTRTTAIPA